MRRRKIGQNRFFIAICLDFFPRENLDPLLITMKSIFGRFLFFRFDKLTKQMVFFGDKKAKVLLPLDNSSFPSEFFLHKITAQK